MELFPLPEATYNHVVARVEWAKVDAEIHPEDYFREGTTVAPGGWWEAYFPGKLGEAVMKLRVGIPVDEDNPIPVRRDDGWDLVLPNTEIRIEVKCPINRWAQYLMVGDHPGKQYPKPKIKYDAIVQILQTDNPLKYSILGMLLACDVEKHMKYVTDPKFPKSNWMVKHEYLYGVSDILEQLTPWEGV